jgi:hypothetical protein
VPGALGVPGSDGVPGGVGRPGGVGVPGVLGWGVPCAVIGFMSELLRAGRGATTAKAPAAWSPV